MNYEIKTAGIKDLDEIFALYHSLIDMPNSTWDDEYPSKDIVKYDLEEQTVLVMRNEQDAIVAAIAISDDEDDFDDARIRWYPDVDRWIALSRLGVAKEMQGKGIAKRMLLAAMDHCRQRGYQAVRFLVSKSNPAPQRAYAKLNFDVCGEVSLYEHEWLCYQKRI